MRRADHMMLVDPFSSAVESSPLRFTLLRSAVSYDAQGRDSAEEQILRHRCSALKGLSGGVSWS